MSLHYKYEAYVCTKETLKKTLEKYGVAIIPSVLTDEECNEMVSGMWDYFEHLSQEWEKPIFYPFRHIILMAF